jgi:hypothetical protein
LLIRTNRKQTHGPKRAHRRKVTKNLNAIGAKRSAARASLEI